MKDLDDTCGYLQAWVCISSIPTLHVRAAAKLLKLFPVLGELEKAAELAKDVIDLLPIVNRRFLDLKDQQFAVSMFSGIAADACALPLEVQKPDQALYYLERPYSHS
jgi:hypothetical protein